MSCRWWVNKSAGLNKSKKCPTRMPSFAHFDLFDILRTNDISNAQLYLSSVNPQKFVTCNKYKMIQRHWKWVHNALLHCMIRPFNDKSWLACIHYKSRMCFVLFNINHLGWIGQSWSFWTNNGDFSKFHIFRNESKKSWWGQT